MHFRFIAGVLFLLQNKGMDAYIFRLKRIGFSEKDAEDICVEFMIRFGAVALDEYITELESDAYVD